MKANTPLTGKSEVNHKRRLEMHYLYQTVSLLLVLFTSLALCLKLFDDRNFYPTMVKQKTDLRLIVGIKWLDLLW